MGKKPSKPKVKSLYEDTEPDQHFNRAFNPFAEFFNPDINDLFKFPKAHGFTECVKVAQPMCAPSRYKVPLVLGNVQLVEETGLFGRSNEHGHYMIKSYSVSAAGRGVDGGTFAKGLVVLENVVEVYCRPKNVIWIEYNLLRSGIFKLKSELYHPRNAEWAEQWQHQPVRAWKTDGEIWTAQPDCVEADLVPKDGKQPKNWKEPKKITQQAARHNQKKSKGSRAHAQKGEQKQFGGSAIDSIVDLLSKW